MRVSARVDIGVDIGVGRDAAEVAPGGEVGGDHARGLRQDGHAGATHKSRPLPSAASSGGLPTTYLAPPESYHSVFDPDPATGAGPDAPPQWPGTATLRAP